MSRDTNKEGSELSFRGITPKAAEPDQRNPKDLLGVKKPPLHLVPAALVLWVSQIFKFSAVKYGPYNWREKKVLKSIYIDAIERHLLSLKDGEWFDPETKKPHVAHIGANCAILLDAEKIGNLIDDMPWKPGPAPALIKEMSEEPKATLLPERQTYLQETGQDTFRDDDSRGNR